MPEELKQLLSGMTSTRDERSFDSWFKVWKEKAPSSPPPDQYDYKKAFEAGANPTLMPDGTYRWPQQFYKSQIREGQKGMRVQTIMERAKGYEEGKPQ